MAISEQPELFLLETGLESTCFQYLPLNRVRSPVRRSCPGPRCAGCASTGISSTLAGELQEL